MNSQLIQPTKRNPLVLKISKTLARSLLVMSLLLTTVLSSYAQSGTSEDAQRPNQLFLPLVAGAANSAAVTQEDEVAAEPGAMSEDNLADYEAVLDEPLPEEVNAAAVDTTFFVTKLTDTNDGACSLIDCSLREALAAAAFNPATHDVIRLPAGTFYLNLGQLQLVNVSLLGTNANTTIIDAQNKSGAIWISPLIFDGTWSELVKVTIRNSAGDGILHEEGALTLKNVRVQSNSSEGIFSIPAGQADSVAIYNSIIEGNKQMGIYLSGKTAHIENSVIQKNEENGIAMYGSAVTIIRSTVTSNGGSGLAIFQGSTANIQSSASLFNKGPGVHVYQSAATIQNSTISGNVAHISGGGISVVGESTVELHFVTVVRNTTNAQLGQAADGGGVYVDPSNSATLHMRNSLIADNLDKGGQAHDCAGAIISEGYNLIENQVGCLIGGSNVGNIAAGQDPVLGTLALNGSKTKNHLPDATSPIVDVIPVAFCDTALDQRGVTRPRDGNGDGNKLCDIGAVER